MNKIELLQQWYLSQCNGEWEHSYGISIETLDNPGWSLAVDLTDTRLEATDFEARAYGVDKASHPLGHDWLACKVERKKFLAHGGPGKLEEMIDVFLAWANPKA